MKVKKRDGRIVDFNEQKIIRAILAAFESVDGEVSQYAVDKAYNIASYVSGYFEEDETNTIPGIEEIQDIIEKGLMATKRKDVAKAYILYREERNKIRNKNSALMQSIAEKIDASDVQNQNANVDEHSFGGRMGEARNELMKDYALNYIVSPMAKENHINNMIYIHDLDSYAVGMHNCLTIPFDDLLAKGFNTRQTDVRPARSINTAFQLVAVIFQLQSLQQFGGVSASHIDWTMVPYVRMSFYKHYMYEMTALDAYGYGSGLEEKDLPFDPSMGLQDYENLKGLGFEMVYDRALKRTERELMQAVEGMYHNLNTLQSRSGN